MTAVQEILELIKEPGELEVDLITRAFNFAEKAHTGQTRFSGEPYFVHPLEVAKILADLKVDAETVAAGLLHDTIEDGVATAAAIETEFGKNILFLVEGVTKLGKLKYQGLERHVESLRKFFVAMAQDIRVIIIRLADRLHNIRTLRHVRLDKQKRIALETLEIYAPLANRLGMWKLKGMLEDASFPYAYPEAYQEVVTLRKTKGKESVRRLEKVARALQKALAAKGLVQFTVDHRIKYLYSLYQKLLKNEMDIEKIYDISALRIIVPTVGDCYQVLGIIHGMWRPVPGKIKDYVAAPKPNGYQSIHTAVFTGDGGLTEIQIRTPEMQREAEYGIASHIAYDEAGKPSIGGRLDHLASWLKELVAWQKQVRESEEFITALKTDFFHDQIFVFTPKGDVIELPAGATPIDFAYAIHSEIGDHAAGVKINGKFQALDTPLQTSDVVEIEVKKNSRPNRKWLERVKTNFARKHIRAATQKETRR